MINEIFYSLQGEGMRAGEASVFLRFSKCNMECRVEPGEKSPGGFDCDTEFTSGRRLTLKEVEQWVLDELAGAPATWIVLTGGEPALQLDREFCDHFHGLGFKLAVETNGSMVLPHHGDLLGAKPDSLQWALSCFDVDWITVSPKVAEHAIRQRWAHEVKYVRGHGQAIPQTRVDAMHKLLSPAFIGMDPDPRAVAWCTKLVKENPEWRMSAQMHKLWRER
jgi:organic radical activating enzyme